MTPFDDVGWTKELYEERLREARADHLAARVARATRQNERRVLLRDTISWLRALAAGAGADGLRGHHA